MEQSEPEGLWHFWVWEEPCSSEEEVETQTACRAYGTHATPESFLPSCVRWFSWSRLRPRCESLHLVRPGRESQYRRLVGRRLLALRQYPWRGLWPLRRLGDRRPTR